MVMQIIAGFIAAVSFAALYRVPRQLLLWAGLTGSLGWTALLLSALHLSEVAAVFIGAATAALCSEFLARQLKQPVTIFLVPGIIPLVPGGKAYVTLLAFLRNDFSRGIEQLVTTVFLVGAIAGGIITVSSLFRAIRFPTSTK